ITVGYTHGKKYISSFMASGGKDVFQFNNSNHTSPKANTINTLFFKKNYMKTYEAWDGKLSYNKEMGEGLAIRSAIEYQDRMPLNNTTGYTIIHVKKREFTPNYPIELLTENIKRHQAFITSVGVSWQPGVRYIDYPDRKENIGSKYPILDLS